MADNPLALSRSVKSRLRFLPARNLKRLLLFNEPPLRERFNRNQSGVTLA
jgi:hypothetical protein